MRVLARLAVIVTGIAVAVPASVLAASTSASADPGVTIATGDTRTVVQPQLPRVCATLPAQLTASGRTFSDADEASPPDTARIQAALDACAGSGGGVTLAPSTPKNAFLSGPLTIRSGETLVVDSGATLYASRNPASYQITGRDLCGTISAAGNGCSPFITVASHSAHNGIMGTGGSGNGLGLLGVIDGRGDLNMYGTSESWWQLAREAESGGKQNNPRLIQANSGTDFTVYNVELANAAQFTLRYTGDGLTVWGIRINARATARNVDGVDPSGTNATIRDSWIQSGDDGIAIKAGSSSATNMTIENNHFYGSHGISIGSETNGGVSNILFRNNTLSGTDSYGNVSTFNNGIRIKSDPSEGGLVQRVTYQDTCMTGVQTPLAFTPFYSDGEGTLIPELSDIVVDGAVAVHSTTDAESQLFGFDADHPLGLTLANVHLDATANQAQYANVTVSNSNLVPSGPGVTVTEASLDGRVPVCTFPPFPSPPHEAARTPVSLTVEPEGEFVAGEPTEVTTTFTNAAVSGAPLRDVQLDLPAPGGWTVTPQGVNTFDSVAPGQTVRVGWQVTPVVGQAHLFAQARYTDPGAGEVSALSPSIPVLVEGAVSGCDGTEFFCDDFQEGNSDNWDLTPGTGSFAVVNEPGVAGNKVLQYTAGNTVGGVIALLKDAAWTGVRNKSDYYVEARIKPQINSTTSSKFLYLIGRYQDSANWYFGGLNVQNSPGSTQVEAGLMKAGSLTRSVQVKRPIVMGTQGGTDGQWYTVRFEIEGSTLTVYLDGEKIGSLDDTAFTSGKIGLYTANKSFLIDDVRVGDASVKPVQLTLDPSALTYSAEAGDAPYTVTVTAVKSDQTPDTFAVASSDPSVVSVSVSGNMVTLTPVAEGTADVVFTSGSDPRVTRTIVATIAPQFIQSSTVYDLSGKTTPVVGETAAYPDGKLALTFDAPPTLTPNGSIRLFKTSDDSLVDVIKMTGDTNSIGAGFSPNARGVNDTPVKVSGNTVIITPHQSKLEYDTGYYVAIADGAIIGTLSGKIFDGIGKASNWSFTTRPAPPTNLTTLTVAASGTSADFRSVQGALNYVMKYVPAAGPATINVMDGTYEELLFLRGVNNVTIKGQSRTGTVIQYENYESLNSGSGASSAGAPTSGGGRSVFLVENADLLTLDTLTLRNTHLRSSSQSNQAETIYFNSDTGRLIAKNADFLSEQDTLQLKGYAWFYNTLVAGNVDFIWGNDRISLFENSEIRMVGDSSASTPSGGYLVQARTVPGERGFVFLNDRLTDGTGPSGNTVATGTDAASFLARAASGSWQDNILFITCRMDNHITPQGWAFPNSTNPAPNPSTPTTFTGWREFGSMDLDGNPLDVSARTSVSGQLTQAEIDANFADRAAIFSTYNGGAGWDPQP